MVPEIRRKFRSTFYPIDLLNDYEAKVGLTKKASEAFNKLKECLSKAPVLCSPDFVKPFATHCDASKSDVGAVLVQVSEEGDERPIAFFSKKQSSTQLHSHRAGMFGRYSSS